MRSSNVRRIGVPQRTGDAAGIGMLPIPDPRTWPTEIRTWYRDAVGECSPLDVFLFNHGQMGAAYLQDAITAAAVLEVDPSEWITERGFPVFMFSLAKIGEVERRLSMCGYTVHVVETAGGQKKRSKQRRAPVVSIACARPREKGPKTE